MQPILATLQQALPVLFVQFATALVLLGLGIACYTAITPFRERQMIRDGNAAAGAVVMGTLVALAIPLAAKLATSATVLDILIWGIVALVIQLAAFAAAAGLMRGLRGMIEAGNVAAALVLVGIQLAVALLNAAAMAG